MGSPRRRQSTDSTEHTGGTERAPGAHGADVPPQPASSPAAPVPPVPPMPARPPESAPSLVDWLRSPRPEAEPGIWRCGHRPRPPEDPDRTPARQLISGALVSFLIAWLIWSLLWHGYLGSYWLWPLLALTPESWRSAGGDKLAYVSLTYVYYGLVIAILVGVFGRLGHWPELVRRTGARLAKLARGGDGRSAGSAGSTGRPVPPPPPESDPARWPELRADGAADAADRLAAELHDGLMSDVDHTRIKQAWHGARRQPTALARFVDTVLAQGAAAYAHPSGLRDLSARAARHDLPLRQVRIGTAADTDRNPHAYRGAGVALDPALLGTSALAVGPPGSGKTHRLVRPVAESLCLQALAGQAAVVAVAAAGTRLAPDDCFDVVVRIGNPDSRHGLDIYGGSGDPDEAAGMLAEALVGDLATVLPGGDSRRAATALAQLIGPYRAAYGRFPGVPELRELLDGSQSALDALRTALEAAGLHGQVRELTAYERQSGRPGDSAALLADRIALLDRPAFADFFLPEEPGAQPVEGPGFSAPGDGSAGEEKPPAHRPFSLRALAHPVRVRVDLPERGHAEASRILARLVLAQFAECAAVREDQSRFACLILDDATQTVTPQSLRALQRLRSANAGALLALRALDDVPESLRAPLLGAVGCRAVCAGVTPWDAERFTEVWGTEWVQTRDVTNRQLVPHEPMTRVMHTIRRLATGRHVTAESVTVRTVRRERWSASDLANELAPGHAVLSMTTVRGDRTPPILTKLGE